jgi:hypothetical protein
LILEYWITPQTSGGGGDVDWINMAQDKVNWQGSCEHRKESLGYIRAGGFLDQVIDCQFLKKEVQYSWS